jgi:DNA-binding MarR family transcriptional regulator
MLRTVERVLEEFRKLDPEMPMQTAMTLILTSRHQDKQDGLSIKDLAEMLGVSTASASRNVAKLTQHGTKSRDGLQLIESFEDPVFRVRKCVRITARGNRFLNSLKEIIEDEYQSKR